MKSAPSVCTVLAISLALAISRAVWNGALGTPPQSPTATKRRVGVGAEQSARDSNSDACRTSSVVHVSIWEGRDNFQPLRSLPPCSEKTRDSTLQGWPGRCPSVSQFPGHCGKKWPCWKGYMKVARKCGPAGTFHPPLSPVPITHPVGCTSWSLRGCKRQVGSTLGQNWQSLCLYSLGQKAMIGEDDAVSPRTVPAAFPLGHVSPGLPQNWTRDLGVGGLGWRGKQCCLYCF
jgi:hypothetical protein